MAVRAVQHVAAPPLAQPRHVRQLVDQAGGHQQPARRAPSGRRPASRRTRRRPGSTAVDLAGHDLRRRSRDLRPAAPSSSRRRHAVAGQQPVHARRPARCAARPRRPPAPTAAPGPASAPRSARRRRRRPPPRRSSSMPIAHRDHLHDDHAVAPRDMVGKLRCRYGKLRGMDDDLDDALAAVGPAAARAAPAARDHAGRAVGADRHLGEHPVPAGVRAAAGPRWSCCCRWPGRYGVTLDELVGAPPTGDPRVHLRPVTRDGMTMLPLTRRAGGIQAFKIIIPAGSRPPGARPADPRGLRVALRPQRPAAAGARRARPRAEAGRGRGVRHPHAALVRRRPSGEAVEFLSLFGKQGERAHLRARPSAPR